MKNSSINLDIILENLNNSEKLLKILLTGFVDKYSEIDKVIIKETQNKNYEEARRLAHSVKGVSGNLAADNLRKSAEKLENAYTNPGKNIEELINNFRIELEKVVDETKELINQYGF